VDYEKIESNCLQLMEIFNIQKKQHDEVFKWIEREKTNDFDVLLNTFIQF